MFVSARVFDLFSLVVVTSACLLFLGLDSFRLQKALREPTSPVVRDRIFGAIIGLITVTIGGIGIYMHWC